MESPRVRGVRTSDERLAPAGRRAELVAWLSKVVEQLHFQATLLNDLATFQQHDKVRFWFFDVFGFLASRRLRFLNRPLSTNNLRKIMTTSSCCKKVFLKSYIHILRS